MMYEPHPQIITDGIEAYERECLYMPSLAVYIRRRQQNYQTHSRTKRSMSQNSAVLDIYKQINRLCSSSFLGSI